MYEMSPDVLTFFGGVILAVCNGVLLMSQHKYRERHSRGS